MRCPLLFAVMVLAAIAAAPGCANPNAGKSRLDPAATQAQQAQAQDDAQAQAQDDAQAMAKAQAQDDAEKLAEVEKWRAAVKARPGEMHAAQMLAHHVSICFSTGLVDRKKLDGEAAIAEVDAALGEVTRKDPTREVDALAAKGLLLKHANRREEAIKTLEASMAARPTMDAFLPLVMTLDEAGRSGEVLAHCKAARPAAKNDTERYMVLNSCLQYSHGGEAEQGLAWAGQADIDFYNAKIEETNRLRGANRAE